MKIRILTILVLFFRFEIYSQTAIDNVKNLTSIEKLNNKAKSQGKPENHELVNFKTIGNLSIFGDNLVPNFNLLADCSLNDIIKGLYAGLNLYGLNKIEHKSKFSQGRDLLITETSDFGFGLATSYIIPLPKKIIKSIPIKLGVNMKLDYCQKKINTTEDTINLEFIKPNIFYFKIGGELVIANRFSIYCNYNYINVLGGLSNFEKYFNTKRTVYEYFDFGIRALLDLKSDEENRIRFLFDLNLVFPMQIGFVDYKEHKVVTYFRIGFSHPIFSNTNN